MKKGLFIIISAVLALSGCCAKQVTPTVREQLPVFPRSTWNALDATDSVPGYDRTMHRVEQEVFVPAEWADKAVTFLALGANQEVTLYVNGEPAGYHAGGYTAFSFDVTNLLRFGEKNLFAADITNAYNADIPPLSADFTFFGGFYRDSKLIVTAKNHISTTFFGTSGVIVETPAVSREAATVRVTTHLTLPDGAEGYALAYYVNGKKVDEAPLSDQSPITNYQSAITNSPTGDQSPIAQRAINHQLAISNPRLWSPDSPYLYKLTVCLTDKEGKVVDDVTEEFGLRWYEFDENGLFVLNGEHVRLLGTNRHQCYAGHGWAVDDNIHRLDMENIKAIGGNFIRVSHYPQDPLVMHLCDSLGLLCSVEIPLVNAITESDAFTESCLRMEEEMVWQNRNHPSVIMWGYANEVLLRPPFKYQKGMWSRHWEYVMNVNKLSKKLNDRLHELDSERYTFVAIHDYFREYHEAGLDTLADVIGHNIYSGWYSGKIEDLDAKVEKIRSQCGIIRGPRNQRAAGCLRPMLVSEYGADCDVRLRSADPQKFDYTVDYAMLYHRHYLDFLLHTDLVAGGTAWNLNDFHSESRGGAVPHLNLKGLITIDRTPKRTWWYYRSVMHPDKAVRAEAAKMVDKLGEMPVAQEFPLCVLLGSNRWFTDNSGIVWLPDKECSRVTAEGGTAYVRKTEHGPLPASDVTIKGAEGMEPVYQTALLGVENVHVDVPDGQYKVTLCLAELETVGEQEMSAYNLGNKALDTGFTGRRFSISVNGEKVADNLHLDTYRATDIICNAEATDGKGIIFALEAAEGQTILNAVKVEKL